MDDWDGYHNNSDDQFRRTGIILWTACVVAAAVVILATLAGLVLLAGLL